VRTAPDMLAAHKARDPYAQARAVLFKNSLRLSQDPGLDVAALLTSAQTQRARVRNTTHNIPASSALAAKVREAAQWSCQFIYLTPGAWVGVTVCARGREARGSSPPGIETGPHAHGVSRVKDRLAEYADCPGQMPITVCDRGSRCTVRQVG